MAGFMAPRYAYGSADWNEQEREFEREENATLYSYEEECSQFANWEGVDNITYAWLLTDYDTWIPNPHYIGRPEPYPYDGYETEHETVFGPQEAYEAAIDHDIELQREAFRAEIRQMRETGSHYV